MRTVTVWGNNSGRNAGDNAILGNLLHDFSLQRQDILFKIPTINKTFVNKHFGHHTIQPMGLLPWNLAVKNIGWPTYKAMTETEMVLITDNILFDRKFNNPLINYLKAISLFAGFSRKRNIPIVLYNASVGPLSKPCAIKAFQKVLNCSPLVITRDTGTRELIEKLNLQHPDIIVHADCALNTEPPPEARMQEIIHKENLFTNPRGTIGLNVNAYIDNFNDEGKLDRQAFCRIIAQTADTLIENLDVDILFTVSQVMDMTITKECIERCKYRNRIRTVGNCDYTYQELTGLLSRVGVHAGLRTHTLIFCASVTTPMININAYHKSAEFLKTVGMGDWTITFDDLSVENLTAIITRSWENKDTLKAHMAPIVAAEKEKARNSVSYVSELLDQI